MSFFRAAALVLLVGTTLTACGSGSRPGNSGLTPARPEQPVVSIPVPPPAPRPVSTAPRALQAAVDSLIRGFDGRAGAAVRAVDDGWTVEAGGRQRLPQQSVSKLWVAMTLLDLRDQGRARLDEPITVLPTDLTLFHQPIAYLVAKTGRFDTTVGGLLTRALTQSDNTANDRLLTFVGGPSAVRAMIQRKRLGDIRFGPGERMLQAGTAGLVWQPGYAIGNAFQIARSRLSPEARTAALDRYIGDPPDGAAPLAIADALARLARGEILSETSTRIMLDTMGASITGRARLRAAIPPGWKISHKTGTGQDYGRRNAGFNDVGLLTAPDGRRYALAVMIGDTVRPIRERQQLIQAVAAAVTTFANTSPVTGASGVTPLAH
ncbi:serine hydrolase [Sphingomonas longa]|jgi:beta-lactamase class A|uniref:serine hydrolase n=1 Tax=Sphingomonas longa TaxID=2778730 RepID=UPI001EF45033|nr:serine hydrolase [Sphingomonas sp. BT552]